MKEFIPCYFDTNDCGDGEQASTLIGILEGELEWVLEVLD